jgi:Zn-finger nucleic acid-binding protein
MNCPKCREPQMDPEIASNGVSYQRCPHCSGMFYEPDALQQVIRDGSGTRDSLAFSVQSDMMDELPAHCFRCKVDMQQRLHNGIRVDECPTCRGVFLDQGEVATLIFAR